MSKETLTGYDLSRAWFDFCFENPDIISPNHGALYFFAIEHCNRLGWKTKFGLPTTMAMEAIGIKSYNTYKKTLNELIEFGFIKMIEISKNQYSSNIIALSVFDKANNKALDKANGNMLHQNLTTHTSKHLQRTVQSTCKSIYSIDKQQTIKPINQEQEKIPLGHLMQKVFLEKNKNYCPAPAKDFPAMVEFATLINQATGAENDFFHFEDSEKEYVLKEWEKVADWYTKKGGNKSLETLAKFKMQEIINDIKNPDNGQSAGTNFNNYRKANQRHESSGQGGY